MLENLNGIALALLPIQAMLVIFYFRRKYPPLRRRDTFGMVIGSGIVLTGLGFASGLTALYAGSYLSLLFGIRSFFGAQNPERFLEHRTGLFNRRSFEGVMQENFGRRYWLVSFGIYNYADVRELYGAQQMDRCLSQIGSWIRKTFPGVNSYYLRNGIFILQRSSRSIRRPSRTASSSVSAKAGRSGIPSASSMSAAPSSTAPSASRPSMSS